MECVCICELAMHARGHFILQLLIPVGIAEIATMLNNLNLEEGSTTTITCEALGYPPPTVVWSRTNGALSARVSVSDSVSVPTGNGNVTRVSVDLTITNIFREDRGDYICFASNSIGNDSEMFTVESKVVCIMYWMLTQIFVLVLPEINHHLVDVTVNETHNANFICQAIGEPFPTITWYFNGVVVNLSDRSKYNSHSVTLNVNVLAFLTIINGISSDVGTYTCQAENIIGSDQTSGILTVNGIYVHKL